MDEEGIRRYFANIHVGDEVEIFYEEEGKLGFSNRKRINCKGYILMIDNLDVYLSKRDPVGWEERKFIKKINHSSVISYKILKRVNEGK